jgi:hypothetical protein
MEQGDCAEPCRIFRTHAKTSELTQSTLEKCFIQIKHNGSICVDLRELPVSKLCTFSSTSPPQISSRRNCEKKIISSLFLGQ